jgi:hypothetical protein
MRGWASTQRGITNISNRHQQHSPPSALHPTDKTTEIKSMQATVTRRRGTRQTAGKEADIHVSSVAQSHTPTFPQHALTRSQPLGRRIKTARHRSRHLSKRPPAHRILPANETDKHTTPLSSSSTSTHQASPATPAHPSNSTNTWQKRCISALPFSATRCYRPVPRSKPSEWDLDSPPAVQW